MKKEEIKKSLNALLEKLSSLSPTSPDYKKTAKKVSDLQEILEKLELKEKLEKEIKEAQNLLKKEKDPEMKAFFENEISRLKKEIQKIEKELKEEKKEKGEILMEIRAGVGGEEAALFAKDLFLMYQKFFQKKGWQMKVLSCHPTDLGGFKEISFLVKGEGVDDLKLEGGVHRVQRIPITEKSGRIHTSTASVAVLSKPKEEKLEIRPEDLKIEVFRASGPGGQYVNKRESAVRITHIPTGISASSQVGRTQHQNREYAMEILKHKLYQKKLEEQRKKEEKERRSQIKFAERSQKIRTYNFPEKRVTDHRIKKTWKKLDEILEGELDEIWSALKSEK